MSKIDIKITKMFKFDGEGAAKGAFSWSLNDAITFSSWRIVEGSKGLFIAAPQQKNKDKYYPLVVINNKTIFTTLAKQAIEAFEADEPKKKAKAKPKQEEFDEEDLPF